MGNFKKVFIIGFVGGLVGYACGAMFTPTSAIAQQINPADAGEPPADPPTPVADAGAAPSPAVVPATACRQWEVRLPNSDSAYLGGFATHTVDEGWEPFAFSDNWGRAVLRRCVR